RRLYTTESVDRPGRRPRHCCRRSARHRLTLPKSTKTPTTLKRMELTSIGGRWCRTRDGVGCGDEIDENVDGGGDVELRAPPPSLARSSGFAKSASSPTTSGWLPLTAAVAYATATIATIVLLATAAAYALHRSNSAATSATASQRTLPAEAACSSISVQSVWRRVFPRLSTGRPAAPAGRQSRRRAGCHSHTSTGTLVPMGADCSDSTTPASACAGGIEALDGATGRTIWRSRLEQRPMAVSCEADLNKDGLRTAWLADAERMLSAHDGGNWRPPLGARFGHEAARTYFPRTIARLRSSLRYHRGVIKELPQPMARLASLDRSAPRCACHSMGVGQDLFSTWRRLTSQEGGRRRRSHKWLPVGEESTANSAATVVLLVLAGTFRRLDVTRPYALLARQSIEIPTATTNSSSIDAVFAVASLRMTASH
uniref:Transmembrane protein n=1 Tax=Macrostomum lignano TaxID=282301 RepID=A0A1I8IYX2_9PLAT